MRKKHLDSEEVKAFVEWLRKKTDKSKNTIDNYAHAIERIYADMGSIDKQSVEKFRDTMVGKYSVKTVHLSIIAYNCYIEKFKKKPTGVVKNIKISRTLFLDNVPTEKEVQTLLDGLKQDGTWRTYFLILLLAQTGARVSEIIRFKLEDCAMGYVSIIGKGRKQRTIFIPDATAKEVLKYYKETFNRETGYIFNSLMPCRDKQEHISTRGCSEVIRKAGAKYGIRKEVCHPHAFRHYFAKQFLKASKNDIVMLADLLGHGSVDTTAIYLRMSQNEAKKKFNKLVSW